MLNLVLDHPPLFSSEKSYPDGRCRIARRKALQYSFRAGSRATQS
jgi:hypothetical protein